MVAHEHHGRFDVVLAAASNPALPSGAEENKAPSGMSPTARCLVVWRWDGYSAWRKSRSST
jgi:hypothetical protein